MRQRKPQLNSHAFDATEGTRELILVKGGRHAYLWAGLLDGSGATYIFSGVGALRALARAILRETTPKPKPRGRKKG